MQKHNFADTTHKNRKLKTPNKEHTTPKQLVNHLIDILYYDVLTNKQDVFGMNHFFKTKIKTFGRKKTKILRSSVI